MSRSIHLRFGRLPSGLVSYPRVLFTRRPALDAVKDPPEFHAHVEQVALAAGDVARYARVCGFDGSTVVPATYPHILAAPLHLKIFAAAAFPLRPMGLLHVANRIETLGKLAVGMTVAVDVAVRGYRNTDAGWAFDLESQLSSRGKPVWRETSSYLSRWEDASERPGGRPPRPPRVPRHAQVLDEFDVTLRTAWDYARVSWDYNPIHLSDPTARLFGLRGAISHGMWSLARLLARPCAPLPARTEIDARFLVPVSLPARVAVKEWSEEGGTRRALCDARSGRAHLYVALGPSAA